MKSLMYYAHSKKIYNTKREQAELMWLLDNFSGKVVCPNNGMGELGSIEPYLKMISKCDGVVLSEYERHIGRGVFSEVERALLEKKLVLCIRRFVGIFYLIKVSRIEIVNNYDWSVYYGKITS